MNQRLASIYRDALTPTMEASGGGEKSLVELEYIFFLKVKDFNEIRQKAQSWESQEQWSILFPKFGMETVVRVRRTVKEGVEKFILANKVMIDSVKGKWELEQEVGREEFEKIKSLAENGMIKDRYFFPIEGTDLVWEFDVFKDANGKEIPWVKVDLEVPAPLDRIPEFPIAFTDSVLKQPKQRTDEEASFVSRLFKEHYVVKPDAA